MQIQAIVTLVYGILIIAGGIMGYVAKHSVPSLISGGSLGLAAVVGCLMLFAGKPAGKIIALIAAALVGGFFAIQLAKAFAAGTSVGRASAILALSLIEILVLVMVKSTPNVPR
jgi:uncharacterized membrane protein (UPF0136 family)